MLQAPEKPALIRLDFVTDVGSSTTSLVLAAVMMKGIRGTYSQSCHGKRCLKSFRTLRG